MSMIETEANDWLDNTDGIKAYSDVESIPIFVNQTAQTPIVTIAIPTFNRINTLKEALESALAQDYADYEIIVVDNNPERDDDTERFMMKYSNHPKCSYYKNTKNTGLFGNWNRCFLLSRTQWVTLLHDDDYYYPEYLSTLLSCLKNHPDIDALSCKYNYWKEYEKNTPINVIDREEIPEPKDLSTVSKGAFLFSHPIGPIGLIFKKSLFLELGGFNEKYYPIADYVFNWRYYRKYKFLRLNVVLANYRMGRNLSSKAEVIETQEIKGKYLRMSYIAKNNLCFVTAKMVDAYYRHQMQSLSRRFPEYNITPFNPISRWNIYLILYKVYTKCYLRLRDKFIHKKL